MNKKIIILDRDGVINHDRGDYIREFEHFQMFDGVAQSIARLSSAGFFIALATNQSALGRKITTLQTVEKIHYQIEKEVEKYGGKVNFIAYCPHHPDENCSCRKPKDGLFKQISAQFKAELTGGYMVGDSQRDLVPAIKHKMKPVLVLTGNGKKTLESLQLRGVLIAESLNSFTQMLLDEKNI